MTGLVFESYKAIMTSVDEIVSILTREAEVDLAGNISGRFSPED